MSDIVKKYSEEEEKHLSATIQELEVKIAERSEFMNEEQASDKEWDDNRRSAYEDAALEHGRLCRDREIAKEQLDRMLPLKPSEKLPEVEADPREDALEAFLRKQEGPNGIFEMDLGAMSRKQRAQAAQEVLQGGGASASAIVPTDTVGDVVSTLERFGDAVKLPSILVTPGGNPVEYPHADNTAQEGEIISPTAQGTQATEQDVNNFGFETMKAFTVSSKRTSLPLELTADSNFDITGFIVGSLTQRIGRTIDKNIISGAGGANAPQGIQGVAKTVAMASATGISPVVDFLNMEFAVNRGYLLGEGGYAAGRMAGSGMMSRGGHTGFALSREAEKLARRATDTRGRPLWEPSLQVGGPARLFGWPVVVSEAIQSPASGNISCYFGSFGYMLMRTVSGGGTGNLQIKSFYDSGTADKNTVMFVGFSRFDQRSMLKPDGSSKNEAIVGGLHG